MVHKYEETQSLQNAVLHVENNAYFATPSLDSESNRWTDK